MSTKCVYILKMCCDKMSYVTSCDIRLLLFSFQDVLKSYVQVSVTYDIQNPKMQKSYVHFGVTYDI